MPRLAGHFLGIQQRLGSPFQSSESRRSGFPCGGAEFARFLLFGLAASRGSDFHSPDESHTDLGRLPFLSQDLPTVWSLLADRIQ